MSNKFNLLFCPKVIKLVENNEHWSLKLNRPEDHNPDCMIVEHNISNDVKLAVSITLKTKVPLFEYYSGENYMPKSKKKSYSRVYSRNNIPATYKTQFRNLERFCRHFLTEREKS